MEDPKLTGLNKLELEPDRKGLKSISVLVAVDFGDECIQQKWGFCHKLNMHTWPRDLKEDQRRKITSRPSCYFIPMR